MKKITPFLWFNGNIEEALNLYTSIFKNSKVINERRTGDPKTGKIFTATFQLEDQEFMALDGGPHYKFNPAVSFFVNVKTQEEVDYFWSKLIANGGAESRCGWLVDKFGLSWQIIPETLSNYLNDPDPVKSQRVMNAMLLMNKIDVKKLDEAYAG